MNMGQYRVLDLVTLGLRDSRENMGKYGGLRKTTFMKASDARGPRFKVPSRRTLSRKTT
jgi:hypothetical protein